MFLAGTIRLWCHMKKYAVNDEQNKTLHLLVGCDLYVSNSWSVVKADDKKRTTSHACYGQRLGGSAAPILSVELQVPGHPNCQFIGRSLVPQMDAGVCRSMLTLPWTCCFEFVPASPLASYWWTFWFMVPLFLIPKLLVSNGPSLSQFLQCATAGATNLSGVLI